MQLQIYLRKIDMDPNLIQCIVSYLHFWKYNRLLQPLIMQKIRNLVDLQDRIGAWQFFEGWLHSDWERLQEQYYGSIISRRSSKRWTIALITQAQIKHNNALDLQIRELHNNLIITGLRQKDRHLSTIPLTWLFTLPQTQKMEWLNQTNLALTQSKKWHFRLRRSWHEHHRRHQIMIMSMQRSLSNWLHNSAWWQNWLQ
jgi:hypothetical protein